ncbi:biotin/lipoyl-binding protein [uncultured Ruminococcus sp.]|uniref:biotin/lipoyl-binding protein n=1 Tax=uncultured Ruminococcus sp. TaxID=165186 RepID=UPI000EC1E410|nr:biotin/lipoyl-binding protein [uncultured Ruminococcus sp.]HCJ41028.1 secretion protein HlyD [Ruminococcus sp.]
MKKLIIFLLCVGIIGGGGYFGYKKYMDSKKKSVVVDVVPVSMMMQPAEWFEHSSDNSDGQIVASNSQRVYIDTAKLVKTVFVEEGQEVKKGDPILEYDMTVVELELTQKENQVKIAEQDIKMAKKELEKIKTYKPSEDAPKPPEIDYSELFGMYDDDESEMSEMPEIPEMPDETAVPDVTQPPAQMVTDVVKPAFTPAEGSGTLESPFIINCTREAEVSKEFMLRIAAEKKCVEICVYNSDLMYLYKWIIVPNEELDIKELESWKVADGITVDEMGQASIDTTVKMYGKLSFTQPTSKNSSQLIPDEPDIIDKEPTPEEDEYGFDIPEYDPDDYYIDPDGTDYVYSRDAIKKMISDKENEIKQLELGLKTANFNLETAKKRKRDGKLYAEIDGFVKKIGKPSGEEDTEEEVSEEDLYREPSPDDKAFAVIEGEGGTEVVCKVNELNLGNAEKGSTISLVSWNTGEHGMAEITSIETEPISYSSQSWGENPNNSVYIMHAKLTDGADSFSIGDWVQVKIGNNASADKGKSNSVYLPIHYVHQDGGDYYIMKADKDDKLKKQYIKVGQMMYGMFIEVKGGLSSKDKICFPYGKDVKEGVMTRETSEVVEPANSEFF